MRLPHNVFRQWWHQPVLDRLDTIERNTRPDTVTVTARPEDQIAFVRSELDRLAVSPVTSPRNRGGGRVQAKFTPSRGGR